PGAARAAGEARYLDYEPLRDDERDAVLHLREQSWLRAGVDSLALDWAVEHDMPRQLAAVPDRVTARTGNTRRLVKQRLTQEINYWDARHAELLEAEAAGRPLKIRPETAYRRARELEGRLAQRLVDLDHDQELTPRPPVVSGGALVMPQGLLD